MAETGKDRRIYKLALLVSLSCVLQISESLIPHPIPGLRLGLASIMTLIALVMLGFRYALEVAVLRTILSSFIMGTFMSPTFILSFSGALISTLVMGVFYWLSHLHSRYRLSIVGISMVGALSHNIVQLCLAYLILVRHGGIFVFLPWLCIGAVFTGWVTGVVAGRVCLELKGYGSRRAHAEIMQGDFSLPVLNHYLPGNTLLHRMPAAAKVSGVVILSLAVLIFSDFRLYIGLFLFLAAITIFSRISFVFLFSRVRRYVSLLLIAFLLPVIFNSGTRVLTSVAYFKITYEGLSTGGLFAFRIVFLILAGSLLVRTTSPDQLARGLARMLSPLRLLGISDRRIATILSLSLMAIPVFWELARKAIREAELRKVRNLRNLIPLLSHFVAALYLETEQKSDLWKRIDSDCSGYLDPEDSTEKTKAAFSSVQKGGEPVQQENGGGIGVAVQR